MKASDLLVRCLEAEGIEYIFGLPGEENADFILSLENSKSIRFILTRHEQGAAFMAESYARLTGQAAGCLGTLGPGATNLITGVADSNMDRAPMLVLTGQGSTTRLHKESHQIMNVVEMFRPATWCQAAVTDSIEAAESLVTDDRVGFFSFIGSARVGWALRSKLAPGTRCALEHGGAAPVVVAEDAALSFAVSSIAKGVYYHAGQVCVSVQRVFAHRNVFDEFTERLTETARGLTIGDPRLEATAVGPLIRHREVQRVDS